MNPAQAAYEQFKSEYPDLARYEWKNAGAIMRGSWDRIAQAAIDAHFQPHFDVAEYYRESDDA